MDRLAGALAPSLVALVIAGDVWWLFAGRHRPPARMHAHPDAMTATGVVRSLESLRDLDYRSWQVVAYREGPPGGALRLRIVGYPGRVRLDHPTPLLVSSGRFLWELADVTLASEKLWPLDGRDAAAEFDLKPLLADLSQNRPAAAGAAWGVHGVARASLRGGGMAQPAWRRPAGPGWGNPWRSGRSRRAMTTGGGSLTAAEIGEPGWNGRSPWQPWDSGRTSPNPMVGALVLDPTGAAGGGGLP